MSPLGCSGHRSDSHGGGAASWGRCGRWGVGLDTIGRGGGPCGPAPGASAAEGKGGQPEGLHVRQDIRAGSWSCPAGTEAPAVPQLVRWQWREVKG